MRDTPWLKKSLLVSPLILTLSFVLYLGSTSDPDSIEGATSLADADPGDQAVPSSGLEQSASRAPALDAGSDRDRTFRKFEEIYGSAESEPLINALFDYAVLSHRLDRGSESYRMEYEQVRRRLSADDEVVYVILNEGQARIPESWGVVRNDLINLVMDLKIPSEKKIDYLRNEVIRNFRISSLSGEAHPDSLCVGTAVDHLSKTGTPSDAARILEGARSSQILTSEEKQFIEERMSAYFPELTSR